ncbi:stromal proCES [Forsythia ovata]|uniref:Stromal proCES n=1 Tax=Forsythia ovata TaxID=205694 RepID=A0ABD1WYU6_9LAMI
MIYHRVWPEGPELFSLKEYRDISCIKDLTSLYELATVEDIYIAYEQLKIDENSLYSCIGIAGAQAGEEVIATVEEEQLAEGLHSIIPVGRDIEHMRLKILAIERLLQQDYTLVDFVAKNRRPDYTRSLSESASNAQEK